MPIARSAQECDRRQTKYFRTSRSRPKSTKVARIAIPEPQAQRIMHRYVAGQSIREISRKEGRARETVTRIVKSEEMQEFVHHMRERFYGLGIEALDAIRHALTEKKDGQLGYRLLTDIGVVPDLKTGAAFPPSPPVPEKSQAERVMDIVERLVETARERARIFGMPVPGPEVVETIRRQVNKELGT